MLYFIPLIFIDAADKRNVTMLPATNILSLSGVDNENSLFWLDRSCCCCPDKSRKSLCKKVVILFEYVVQESLGNSMPSI